MRRQAGPSRRALFIFGTTLVLSLSAAAVVAAPARAATICVGSRLGCVATLQAALVAVQPGTGRVLAYYGGHDGKGKPTVDRHECAPGINRARGACA